MEILSHFLEENREITILTLKDNERDQLLDKLPLEFKRSYISDEDLNARMLMFSSTIEKELSEILPDDPTIMSGDFGEMLCYFFCKDKYRAQAIEGPRKWIWKQEKNVAAPYSDVILFAVDNLDTPSQNDILISAESKMKATKNKDYHPIQAAVNGANKDYVTRIAASLSWLRKKYKEEAIKENDATQEFKRLVKTINRFIQSETVGEYTKKVKAIAIVDKNFVADEIAKELNLPDESNGKMEIFIISIKDLKDAYQRTHQNILTA